MFSGSKPSQAPVALPSTLVRISQPIYYTRSAQFRKDEMYGVGRTTLIKSWSIITPDVTAKMTINGVSINLDGMDGRIFDSAFIRNSLRDIFPETPEDNKLCNVEAALFGVQLLCTEYYRHFPSSNLFDMIFTGDLCIQFFPECSTGQIPERIDIEETYAISEAQLLQRIQSGETLEDIEHNCRDESISLSVG